VAAQSVGFAPAIRIIAIPALAETPEEPCIQEVFPPLADPRPHVTPARTVLDRVVRTVEGAAALTGVGAMRTAPECYVLYMRGVLVLRLEQEGDGVAVTLFEPERRQVHIHDSNFPRWGPDLHEQVVQLAQDPRLLDRPEVARSAAVDEIAASVDVRVTGRWLPWSQDGSDPVEWVGIDPSGRPVLGLIRRSVGLADVPAVCSALAVFAEERDLWVPGATGPARIIVSAESLDPRFETALAAFDVDVERAVAGSESEPPVSAEPAERERRGRRRSRRRRRPRAESTSAGVPQPSPDPSPSEPELVPPFELPEEKKVAVPFGFEELPPAEAESSAEPPAEPPAEISSKATEAPPEKMTIAEEEPEYIEEIEEAAVPVPFRAEEATEDEVEAAVLEHEPPRPRRPRAAIVVRNEIDSILASLVLARERRHVVLFWACRQEELMEFFKTGATDLADNVDILLVGFTAQPVPKEVLHTAELYRGRIQWFDHHSWPIEDQEILRGAVGEDAIVLAEGASSALAAVMRVAERRSRFTDKLIDFAARRLSEVDMEKWGYRLVALLERIQATTGDHRQEIVSVLAGKPSNLPAAQEVHVEEKRWLEEHDPRVIHFGGYQMVVVQVPEHLDAGEVARRARNAAGCRLSLASREGDETVMLVANEEKRHINVQGVAECLSGLLPWVELRPSGDRKASLLIDDLPRHPERLEQLIGEIARHKSLLHG
jgi:hypothetical protein